MYYTKFIATPFSDFNTNVYVSDIITDILEMVAQNDGETVQSAMMLVIQSEHPYLSQYIDLYIGDEGDRELIEVCGQIDDFLMKTITEFIDIFECIAYHQDLCFTVSALASGIVVRFYVSTV